MIGLSMQENIYPCLSDEPVFSLQTACNEILKNVFTTERGFEQEESRDDYEDDSISCNSIATDSTRKTRNSVVPSPPKNTIPKLYKAESAAELQYRCNQRAQRIQRDYERVSSKSKEDHARHLHERYGNRAMGQSS